MNRKLYCFCFSRRHRGNIRKSRSHRLRILEATNSHRLGRTEARDIFHFKTRFIGLFGFEFTNLRQSDFQNPRGRCRPSSMQILIDATKRFFKTG